MTAEVQRYSLEQIESLELAPGAEHQQLEGSIPSLATDDEVRQALEKAFDYRGVHDGAGLAKRKHPQCTDYDVSQSHQLESPLKADKLYQRK